MKRLAALFLSLVLLAGCAPAAPAPAPPPEEPDVSVLAPIPQPEPEPIVAHLMVAGDAMSHMPITRDAYVAQTDSYDYSHMLTAPAAQLARADYALANLETVLAGGPKYSGFPAFNSPDALAFDLKEAGFDLLSTANNHSLDQGTAGIFRTLDVLDQAGLAHVGTYRSQAERDESRGIYVADVGGISVAFLSYTYGLNGYRLPEDKMWACNRFNTDYYTTICTPDYPLLKADMAAARALGTDLIAVITHWGIEYQYQENHHQRELAEFLVAQGADLVLGGHPHVLQPYGTITARGVDGAEKTGFVCYSLGNLISNQLELDTMTTVILDLELTRDPKTEKTTLTNVSYTPYFMVHRDTAPVGERRFLANTHEALAQPESFTAGERRRLEESLALVHQILGPEGDPLAS